MKEYLNRLRPCPFCHNNTITFTWINQVTDQITAETSYVLYHYCRPDKPLSICISVYGETEDECIERWNADGQEHSAK